MIMRTMSPYSKSVRQIEYYCCPSLEQAKGKLHNNRTYVKAFCHAMCGTIIVYPIEADDKVPKVCENCNEWLANPMGNA